MSLVVILSTDKSPKIICEIKGHTHHGVHMMLCVCACVCMCACVHVRAYVRAHMCVTHYALLTYLMGTLYVLHFPLFSSFLTCHPPSLLA